MLMFRPGGPGRQTDTESWGLGNWDWGLEFGM